VSADLGKARRQGDLVASILVVGLFMASTFLLAGRFDASASVARSFPGAALTFPATNDFSMDAVSISFALGVLTYFLLPFVPSRKWLLCPVYAFALALGCISAWCSTRAGVAVFNGPIIVRPGPPWQPDVHASLAQIRKIVSGCVTQTTSGARGGATTTDRFVIYLAELNDGRQIRFSDAVAHNKSPARLVAGLRLVRPWLEAPGVAHQRHTDGHGHDYMDPDCLHFFRQRLSSPDYADLTSMLHATPDELAYPGSIFDLAS
jgi:hypothetical protein